MESLGSPNRIHVTQKTADELIMLGKKEWLTPRSQKIQAKGKGEMQTYWVEPGGGTALTNRSGTESAYSGYSDELQLIDPDPIPVDEGQQAKMALAERMVQWNSTIFVELIKRLIAHRKASGQSSKQQHAKVQWTKKKDDVLVRDEVVQSIPLPAFNKVEGPIESRSIQLDPVVRGELQDFISQVAQRYNDNPFHNFDHATHVTMSTKKLLQRIVTKSKTLSQQELYIHSFGVASDPLAQLAVVFSALIHDLDHRGVPNPVLIKEAPDMATYYCGKSIAEQNSIDLGWELFMSDPFENLRSCIFTSEEDLKRFRQLVINAVMVSNFLMYRGFDKRQSFLLSIWLRGDHSPLGKRYL